MSVFNVIKMATISPHMSHYTCAETNRQTNKSIQKAVEKWKKMNKKTKKTKSG